MTNAEKTRIPAHALADVAVLRPTPVKRVLASVLSDGTAFCQVIAHISAEAIAYLAQAHKRANVIAKSFAQPLGPCPCQCRSPIAKCIRARATAHQMAVLHTTIIQHQLALEATAVISALPQQGMAAASERARRKGPRRRQQGWGCCARRGLLLSTTTCESSSHSDHVHCRLRK